MAIRVLSRHSTKTAFIRLSSNNTDSHDKLCLELKCSLELAGLFHEQRHKDFFSRRRSRKMAFRSRYGAKAFNTNLKIFREDARERNRFTLLPLNPAGNPAIVSRYEPGIISRANVFQPLPTCESRLRLTLAATQIKSAPALSRSGSLSVYSIGFYSMI